MCIATDLDEYKLESSTKDYCNIIYRVPAFKLVGRKRRIKLKSNCRLSIILGSGNGVIPDKLHERCEKIKEVREQAEKLLTQKQ